MTTNLRIYTDAFPLVVANSLKYAVYKATDPLVEIQAQTFAAPHPLRHVSFVGLERANYIWRLIEMNGAVVVRVRAEFSVVPDNNEVRYKAPITIETDYTPGIVSVTNSFTFDGTGGTYDWRGWEIYPERIGMGTMKRGMDYSWDPVLGKFDLLAAGDEFQPGEFFNVEFGLIIQQSSITNAQSIINKRIITNTTVLGDSDIGKDLIIKGVAPYFEVTLPDLDTCKENILIRFEFGRTHKNVKLKCKAGQTIDWKNGGISSVIGGVCEHITFFKEIDGIVKQWRVNDYQGNFLSVGRIITTDQEIPKEFNCVAMDGSSLSVTEYARLYEWVLQLPPAQVVTFANWINAGNGTKFSLESGGFFKVPDRRGLYTRNTTGLLIPGIYQANQNKEHFHGGKVIRMNTEGGNRFGFVPNHSNTDAEAEEWEFKTKKEGGTEARPETAISNQYILT